MPTSPRAGLAALKADRQFSEKQFLTGAAAAFEMIPSAYADGDIAKLKAFSATICCRVSRSRSSSAPLTARVSRPLDELRDAKIVDAKVFDNVASVTVEFQSTQTRMLTDSDDNSIEDDTGPRSDRHLDFERDLTLDDPNWKLAETETPTRHEETRSRATWQMGNQGDSSTDDDALV